MKKRFQRDDWQHRYATPQDRRDDMFFVVSALLALIAVAGAILYALTPAAFWGKPAASTSLVRTESR